MGVLSDQPNRLGIRVVSVTDRGRTVNLDTSEIDAASDRLGSAFREVVAASDRLGSAFREVVAAWDALDPEAQALGGGSLRAFARHHDATQRLRLALNGRHRDGCERLAASVVEVHAAWDAMPPGARELVGGSLQDVAALLFAHGLAE